MRRTRLIGTTVAALLFASTAPAGAQVVNGGFEDPDVGGTFTTVTSLPGWTAASGNVDHINNYWTAYEGGQSLDLNGNTAATIYQDVLTTPGGSYNLFFALAGNPVGGDAEKSVRVWWGEPGALSAVGVFSFSTTGRTVSNMGWELQEVLGLVATSGTMRLQFESLETGFFGPALDAISLSATASVVPEPSTVILLASGLLALGGVQLRRRARRTG